MNTAPETEYLTIKEAADALGVTVQAVYQRLEKDFKPYLKIINGKKRLDKRVLDFSVKAVTSNSLTSDFKDVLKLLEKQLEEKDRQLAAKDKQIEELNKRLAEAHQMATQAQQLHGAEKVLQLEEGKKQSFFKRLFSRDID
jgi:predicted ArsR family transcriptional regulator